MHFLSKINLIISIIFTVCYSYQFIYVPISLFIKKKKTAKGVQDHSFAVMICARNEETVIADLLESLKMQTYPQENISVFVMADNCTDRTAEIAGAHGAKVYSRNDQTKIGKGYALESLMAHIAEDNPKGFDGYFVFDADNLLERDYIEKMNETFSEGSDIITSYRASKNYGSSWISAGYALWFLRESRYLNGARNIIGSSCNVSGTGFMFSRRIAEKISPWRYHTLTEDTEFSVDQITDGEKISFCEDAVLYDEQPITFSQSWRQRMRWSRGYLQVLSKYGRKLLKGMIKGSFSCFDMCMTIMPAFILSALSLLLNTAFALYGAIIGADLMIAVRSICSLFGNAYLLLWAIGALTTVTERKNINVSSGKKIFYTFTFPLFMFTYIPISIAALFIDTGWKPIRHTVTAKQIGKS